MPAKCGSKIRWIFSLALPKRIVMKAPWQSILIRFVK